MIYCTAVDGKVGLECFLEQGHRDKGEPDHYDWVEGLYWRHDSDHGGTGRVDDGGTKPDPKAPEESGFQGEDSGLGPAGNSDRPAAANYWPGCYVPAGYEIAGVAIREKSDSSLL